MATGVSINPHLSAAGIHAVLDPVASREPAARDLGSCGRRQGIPQENCTLIRLGEDDLSLLFLEFAERASLATCLTLLWVAAFQDDILHLATTAFLAGFLVDYTHAKGGRAS
jgi:hypothetical protein